MEVLLLCSVRSSFSNVIYHLAVLNVLVARKALLR